MAKRKKIRKQESKANKPVKVAKVESKPLAGLLINILAIFLAVLLIVALTLYVLKKMPARGFWSLVILLSIVAFGVLPWMRKRYG
jgi:hypothetical protein